MRLIDAEKFEVFNATCPITKWVRSDKTAAYFYVEGCRKVLEAIDAAPTIDPETLRPTAHWTSVKDRLPDPYEKVLVRLDHWAGGDPMTKQQLVDEYAREHLCATCEWKNGNICTLPRCMKLEERRANDQRRIQPKESVAMEIPTQQES